MIIDAHTHLGRPGGALESRASDMIISMDKATIDKAMVFAGRLNSITTQEVIDEIQSYGDRLYAVGSVSPQVWYSSQDLAKTRDWLRDGQIKALKFYPGYEPFYPADSWLRPFLNLLVEYDLPAIFHSGDTFSKAGGARLKYALPLHIDDLAVDMPDLKIIIAHLGYPWQREAGEVVYKNKNVYSDCSGGAYGEFDNNGKKAFTEVWDEFVRVAGGEDKILFGTDWPISDQSSYVELIKSICANKDTVFYKNAVELFNL